MLDFSSPASLGHSSWRGYSGMTADGVHRQRDHAFHGGLRRLPLLPGWLEMSGGGAWCFLAILAAVLILGLLALPKKK